VKNGSKMSPLVIVPISGAVVPISGAVVPISGAVVLTHVYTHPLTLSPHPTFVVWLRARP
jgi:hypothetical protein